MVERPYNHVNPRPSDYTPELIPDLTELLVSTLEAMCPPMCLGKQQTVEDHLRYAGIVEFVGVLRSHLERYHTEDQEGDITQDVL